MPPVNICCIRRLLCAAALLAAVALPAIADDAPVKCKLVRVANWHVHLLGTTPILEGSINGKKIGVLIDTGAYASLVTKDAAARLGLPTHQTGQYIVGTGGESRLLMTRIDELKVGDFSTKGIRVRVGGELPFPGIDFVLGQDFLKAVDIEFDYANGSVKLFQPLDCGGKALSYWDPDALQLPLSGSDKDLISIIVNGRKATAQIDSGASQTVVHLDFAEKLGITPKSPGVEPSQCTYGLGASMVRQWVARFDTVQIGGETIRNPRIRLGEYVPDSYYYHVSDSAEVLLGGDFLKAHHVLLSHSQGRVYLSYTGGLVFPAIASLNCNDERVAGKSAEEAIKIYGEVLAANPRDVDALIRRAALTYSRKDAKGALSDLDAAIAADPSNSVALSLRARVRYELQDYAGALADTDAAISRGMRTADMLVSRAFVHRALHDNDGALADFDEALKLDPHNVNALRRGGHFLYALGRYEAAEANFVTLLAVRPYAFDSLWLYLARARRGLDARDVLEQGMKTLKGDEWPMPILQYMAGRLEGDALMAAAASNEKERKGRECEARYYSSQRLLISGKTDEAKPLLEAVRDQCPRNFFEYDAAIVELGQAR
jgi:clan AA aspartic protease (TIGR02281 family)